MPGDNGCDSLNRLVLLFLGRIVMKNQTEFVYSQSCSSL
jgi:hypothetical protein